MVAIIISMSNDTFANRVSYRGRDFCKIMVVIFGLFTVVCIDIVRLAVNRL